MKLGPRRNYHKGRADLSRGLLRDYEPSFESLVFTVQCAQGVGPQQPRGSSRLVTTGSSSHRSERVHKEAASGGVM